MKPVEESTKERLSRIKLLAMDVDGTLTDGAMLFLNGEQMKAFSVYDGLGIRLAMSYGMKIAWVTGNLTSAVADRARTLGVDAVYQNARYKSEAMDKIAMDHGLSKDEIAYIGDDLNDLPAFDRAGFCFAPANAVEEVKRRADIVTQRRGGEGAVREAIEVIVKAKGDWDKAIAAFLEELAKEESGKPGPEAVA